MSWGFKELNELCFMNSGGTPSRSNSLFYSGNIPWAKISDIESTNNGIIYETEEYISELGLIDINNRIFEKGTLLLAMYGSVGKVAFTGVKMSTNQAILGIRIKDEDILDYSYLKYWFLSVKSKLVDRAVGGTLQNISLGIVKELQIPLPPLAIQKRIAKILDAADALRRKDQELLKKYDELAQAIFIDMFGDPVKNDKGWDRGKIGDVALEVNYGTSKPAKESGEFPYLRMNNITYSGDWDFSNLKYIDLDKDEQEKYLLEKDDLVFNRTNSKELVGKTAVYNGALKMAIAGYLIRLRANKMANTSYLSGYLNSIHGKSTLFGMCKSIIGMANINAKELQSIKILIPPIELQNRYKKFMNELVESKRIVQNQQEKSLKIFNSLLQKAFKGELVS